MSSPPCTGSNVRNHYDVTDFEIHNEPNIPGQGWTPEATETEYYTFAKYTDDAISYVFHTYLPGRSFHVYAPATSNSTWPRDVLHAIPQYFDSMDIHVYGDFRSEVEEVHSWMSQAGYANEPLWVTEWGSYKHQYSSEPFGVTLINDMIYGSSPGNDYVYWERHLCSVRFRHQCGRADRLQRQPSRGLLCRADGHSRAAGVSPHVSERDWK